MAARRDYLAAEVAFDLDLTADRRGSILEALMYEPAVTLNGFSSGSSPGRR